ncbi:multicopper oxidase [Plectosphaerella cucumerina]|uniref:Multicopper oxidase n=1 Tax=Plectosphaerella cucumerina TaxID=40658 RepID=A0A8K0X9Y8_9PEZI|nr:multicopper oxidase [Plectosphaerella cucumerina]
MLYSSLCLAYVGLAGLVQEAAAKDWEGQPYHWLFSQPLPIPEVKKATRQVNNPVTNKPINYYEIDIKAFEKNIYPGQKPTQMTGYDGMSPGPTFIVEKGEESVVRFTNKAENESAIHLHGSYSRSPWDGWAEDVIKTNEYKDYYWPNSQSARVSWYHDHAMNNTAHNVYFGQAGIYIVHDKEEDKLNLPSGYGKFDIPLLLEAKQYGEDGTLLSPGVKHDSLYGDVVHVNGQPWPYLHVEPRKYRFRLLNAAVSRSFILYLRDAGGANVTFQAVAGDAGLFPAPVTTPYIGLSMAERYDIIVDFSPFANQNLTLRNREGVGSDDDYKETVNVIRFIVGDKCDEEDKSVVPETLAPPLDLPKSSGELAHSFKFARTNNTWTINGIGFSNVNNRVLANVPRGTVEIWELENNSGGWTHPVHVHLIDFRVISRTGGRNRGVLPYEAAGLKDVVWLDANETVRVEAWYAPWDGEYMFHCHNLVHEDREMMAAFNVTSLKDLGYEETSFSDPMEARWRAVPVATGDYEAQAVTDKIETMARLQPYNNVKTVEEKLREYWDKHGKSPKMRRGMRFRGN